MRRSWPVVLVPLGAIAFAALVGVLRRESGPRTPGAVVKDFLHHVTRDRYERAATLLAGKTEAIATRKALRDWKAGVERGLGEVRRVRGKTEWISGKEAEAMGVLVTDRRERRLAFGLERDRGGWKITRLDGFWGAASEPTGSVRFREAWRERSRSTAETTPR